jgi:hypothetical protein
LRESGRCHVLGIQTGGVDHPSSNAAQLQGLSLTALHSLLRCRVSPALVVSDTQLRSLLLLGQDTARLRSGAPSSLFHHCPSNARSRQFHIL